MSRNDRARESASLVLGRLRGEAPADVGLAHATGDGTLPARLFGRLHRDHPVIHAGAEVALGEDGHVEHDSAAFVDRGEALREFGAPKGGTMAHEGYHELDGDLRPETKDLHRAIVSLQEELEAADWYQQRVDATNDEELSAILAHNRDEEKEHAAMLLEWLRRHDPAFDQQLRTYLFHPEALADELREAAEKLGR